MKNIIQGSVEISEENRNKNKLFSILSNFINGVKPTIEEDKFVDEQISKLNLLKIDTSYEIKFEHFSTKSD